MKNFFDSNSEYVITLGAKTEITFDLYERLFYMLFAVPGAFAYFCYMML